MSASYTPSSPIDADSISVEDIENQNQPQQRVPLQKKRSSLPPSSTTNSNNSLPPRTPSTPQALQSITSIINNRANITPTAANGGLNKSAAAATLTMSAALRAAKARRTSGGSNTTSPSLLPPPHSYSPHTDADKENLNTSTSSSSSSSADLNTSITFSTSSYESNNNVKPLLSVAELSPLRFPGEEITNIKKETADTTTAASSSSSSSAAVNKPFTISSSPLVVSLACTGEESTAVAPVALNYWSTPVKAVRQRKSLTSNTVSAPPSADPRVEAIKERVATLLKSKKKGALEMRTPMTGMKTVSKMNSFMVTPKPVGPSSTIKSSSFAAFTPRPAEFSGIPSSFLPSSSIKLVGNNTNTHEALDQLTPYSAAIEANLKECCAAGGGDDDEVQREWMKEEELASEMRIKEEEVVEEVVMIQQGMEIPRTPSTRVIASLSQASPHTVMKAERESFSRDFIAGIAVQERVEKIEVPSVEKEEMVVVAENVTATSTGFDSILEEEEGHEDEATEQVVMESKEQVESQLLMMMNDVEYEKNFIASIMTSPKAKAVKMISEPSMKVTSEKVMIAPAAAATDKVNNKSSCFSIKKFLLTISLLAVVIGISGVAYMKMNGSDMNIRSVINSTPTSTRVPQPVITSINIVAVPEAVVEIVEVTPVVEEIVVTPVSVIQDTPIATIEVEVEVEAVTPPVEVIPTAAEDVQIVSETVVEEVITPIEVVETVVVPIDARIEEIIEPTISASAPTTSSSSSTSESDDIPTSTWTWSPDDVLAEEDLFATPFDASSSGAGGQGAASKVQVIIHAANERLALGEQLKMEHEKRMAERMQQQQQQQQPSKIQRVMLEVPQVVAIEPAAVAPIVMSTPIEPVVVKAPAVVVQEEKIPIVEEKIAQEVVVPLVSEKIKIEPIIESVVEPVVEQIVEPIIEQVVEPIIAPAAVEAIEQVEIIAPAIEETVTSIATETTSIIEGATSSSITSYLTTTLLISGFLLACLIGGYLHSLEAAALRQANLGGNGNDADEVVSPLKNGVVVATGGRNISPFSFTSTAVAPVPVAAPSASLITSSRTSFPKQRPSLSPIRPVRKINFEPTSDDRVRDGLMMHNPVTSPISLTLNSVSSPSSTTTTPAFSHLASRLERTEQVLAALKPSITTQTRLHVDVPMMVPTSVQLRSTAPVGIVAAPTPAVVEPVVSRSTRRRTAASSGVTPQLIAAAPMETRRSTRLSRKV